MAVKKKKSRKVWWAILVIIAFPVAMNLFGMSLPKRYTAEMRLMVDQPQQAMGNPEGPLASIDDLTKSAAPRSAQTDLDILTGSDVLQAAMQQASEKLPDKIKMDQNAASLYESLVRRMTVDNELNSDILTIRVTENDPEVAAELANDIGLAYTDYMQRLAKESGSEIQRALTKEINLARGQLKSIDKQIQELKTSSQVYDVQAAMTEKASTKASADQHLAQAQAQYQGAVAQLKDAELQIKGISKDIASSTHMQLNPVVISLQQQLATEQTNLAELRATYHDDFPLVKRQKERLARIQAQLKGTTNQVNAGSDKAPNPVYQAQESAVVQLKGQVQSYARQVSDAQAERDRAAKELAAIPIMEQKLQGLVRDRTVKEQNYQLLVQRETQVEALGVARQPTSRIVSPALTPEMPSFPDPKLFTLAGLALGGFLAILILMPRPEQSTDYIVPVAEQREQLEQAETTHLESAATPEPKLLSHEGERSAGAKRPA